ESAGREPVRGVETSHYSGLLELRRLIDQEPAASRKKLLEDLESSERTMLPFDIWVDDEGLARRLRAGDWTTQRSDPVTVEFFDLGVDASIKAPPQNEVISPQELSKLAERKTAECEEGSSAGTPGSGDTHATATPTYCLSITVRGK